MPQPASIASNRPTLRPAPTHPDLITKYNLASKLTDSTTTSSEATDSDASTPVQRNKQAWSADKSQRQAALQKKKEQMILRARKMMEERDKAAKAGATD
jgi:coupling of ubiquitin conjugation to ER degradation protein 1